jgi:hypothetical protein
MDEKLGKDLKVAIFLRGLPRKCRYLVNLIKVRERFPDIVEVINLVWMETQAEEGNSEEEAQVHMAQKAKCAN